MHCRLRHGGTKHGAKPSGTHEAGLTAARTTEVLGAGRGEPDFDARTWTVPGERMKSGREHRVERCIASQYLTRPVSGRAGSMSVAGVYHSSSLSWLALPERGRFAGASSARVIGSSLSARRFSRLSSVCPA